MTYIHILVYVSTLTGLIVQIVLTELVHNHVCETVNILTGLMHTMYICDNMVQIHYQIQREGRELRLRIVS